MDLSSRHSPQGHPDPGYRHLSLLTGVVVALLLTFFPDVARTTRGAADPIAATLLLWAMTAGFVAGGVLPLLLPVRLRPLACRILSSSTCLGSLVLAVVQVATH